VQAVVLELVHLLARDDTDANTVFEMERELLVAAGGDVALRLEKQLHNYDYLPALETAQLLIQYNKD